MPGDQRIKERDFVSIDDFSNDEILGIFEAADRIAADLKAWSHLCPGFILATLFHEPSTRTRLSFESSMLRLGGGVISVADAKSSSAAKGEALADSIRIVAGSYADLIVLRHPRDGAARLAADYSRVPVVNAGDGSHEHPTQTLCDLYSLKKAKGDLAGLDVVLCGDLKHSRTVHSLSFGLARFGANIVCAPHPGLEMPDYVIHRLREDFRCEPRKAGLAEFRKMGSDLDALYFTPESPHQPSLFPLNAPVDLKKVDALYVTRPQTERFSGTEEKGKKGYLRIDRSFLMSEKFRNAIVMHPLPRTEELAPELDKDPRSLYFQQAALGVPVRMAILASLLGKIPWRGKRAAEKAGIRYRAIEGMQCPNASCISQSEKDYAELRFRIFAGQDLRARCEYCERELAISWVGSRTQKNYSRYLPSMAKLLENGDCVLFGGEEEAVAAGFHPVTTSIPQD